MTNENMNEWVKKSVCPHQNFVAKTMLEKELWRDLIDAVDEEAEELCAKKCATFEGLFGYDKWRNHTTDYRMGVDFALIILENDTMLQNYVTASKWKRDDCVKRLNFQSKNCVVPQLRHTDTERVIQRAINDVKSIFIRRYDEEIARIIDTHDWIIKTR